MDQYIGKLLDNRYEILECIGTGGMAMVYKARCHRLNRLVAIKILRSDLAQDAEFRRRFHDESQAVAMLSHPNIVAVYDVSRSSELEYIVMELIDGITLKQYMQKKGAPLNWREALHFITQIMKALSHAHGRGIIHRDIKPQNIMVLRDGSVKVADFGIARLISAAQSTLTQEALGSVHYISPEQARGSRIDARSDIYSAGVMLYEMLTGRLPFEGESPVSVAIQHINSIPLPPRELNPEIPESLEAITLKAMAPNTERRYESADAMLGDLEEFRKNPNINFDFTPADLIHPSADEPTQVIGRSIGSARATQRNRDRQEDYDDSASRWTVPLAVMALLIFLVGVGYFIVTFFLGDVFRTAPEYTVPNVVGVTWEQAMSDPSIDRSIFELVQAESPVFTSEYEAGVIAEQDPESGKKVKGSKITITVTVSGGEEHVTMIDLYNMEYSRAVIELKKLGLSAAPPEYKTSPDITRGNVMEFTPGVGTELAPGTQISLVVSQGPVVKTVSMPSFLDQTLETATRMVKDSGLTLGTVTEVYSDKPAGTVVHQNIPLNQEVEEGTVISFQVSKGPAEPSPSPTPPVSTTNPAGPDVFVRTVRVTLPEEVESVQVRVEVDGVVQFNSLVYRSNGSTVSPQVTGMGIHQIAIYFDNVLQESFPMDFTRE